MPDWTTPPSAEGVSTIAAAKLMGFSQAHFRVLMRKYGVSPVREYASGTRIDKFWNPAVVLQVRAAHRLSKIRVRHDKEDRATAERRRARTHVSRAERLDNERLKILQRVATRQGTTVEKLCVDKGLEAWYHSLPPKHRRHDGHGK